MSDVILSGGMGWFSDPAEVLAGEQLARAQQAQAREQREAERAAGERQEAAENRLWLAQHSGKPARTPGEVVADAVTAMDRADSYEALKQHDRECGCGTCSSVAYENAHDAAVAKAETRLNKWEMKREQEKRERLATPEERRIAELKSELTQLKSSLSAAGIDPLPGSPVQPPPRRDRPRWAS